MKLDPPCLAPSADARQHDEHERHGDGAADARRDLCEGHELHPVGSGQDGDVAGAALAAVAGVDDGGLDRIHVEPAPDQGAGRHQGHHGRDDRDHVGDVESRHQLVPGRERDTDGEQQRIGDGGREELVDHLAALLELGRHRAAELREHRQEQHRDRRRQAEQAVTQYARQIERDGGKPGGGDRAHIDPAVVLAVVPAADEVEVVMLVGLQAPFAGEARIALAHVVEHAREDDRRQAAEHDRRQHLREHIALRLVEDLRIADGERNCAFADAARHDRQHHEEEAVAGAEPHQHPDRGSHRGGGERT